MHSYTAKLILRTSKKNVNGESPIALQMFINGQRVRIATGQNVKPDNWDPHIGRVIPRAKSGIDKEEASDINLIIARHLEKANGIFREARIKDQPLCKDTIMAALNNTMSRNSFHEWVWNRIEELQGVRAPKTLTGYRVTFSALREFSPVMRFADLTPEMIERFDRWIRVDRRLGVNCRAKYHAHIKSFSRALAQQYKGIPDLYQHFKIKQVSGNRGYLVRAEVQALTRMYDANVLGDRLQEMLAMFLFSCHTGLRYSDLVAVKHENIINGYLTFMPIKTQGIEKRVEVPLNQEAMRLIQNERGTLFPYTCNEYYRRQLKEIARLSGIRKPISSHVGRHTFATGYIMGGGSVPVLQRLMGHGKIETTMIYVHLSKQRIEEERSVIDSMHHIPQPENNKSGMSIDIHRKTG